MSDRRITHHREPSYRSLLSTRRRSSRGAVLVEFALIFPVFAMLVFGVLTGGLVLNKRMTVNQAAREGARYGATVPADQCSPTSLCGGKSWAQKVQAEVVARSEGTLKTSQVCVALVKGVGTAPAAVSSLHTTKTGTAACYVDKSGDTGERVQVLVTYTDKIEAVLVSVPLNLTAKAVAKAEN